MEVSRGFWRRCLGEKKEDPLSRRIRVHANAAEYFPVALLLLVAVENIVAINWMVHTLCILLMLSRFTHAVGLRGMAGESIPRVLGTAGTITMISVAAILVLVNSFQAVLTKRYPSLVLVFAGI